VSRLRVVVLFGGRSVEREVSRISARTIVGALDPARYEVVPLAIAENGRFLTADASAALLGAGSAPEKYRLPEAPSPGAQAAVPAQILPGRADVVFPIIHGTTGEDGALQGFLELLDIPYVGAGVTGSAIGMDKAVFKALLRDAGISTPRSIVVSPGEREAESARGRLEKLGISLPVFVKPSAGGSSVGVSKVKSWEALGPALELAFRYDERALVEGGIDARELECAVLGNSEPRASAVGEVVPGREFYDYEDKYVEDRAKLLIPAPVPEEIAQEVRRLAVEAYRLCGISGMARVDFFLERGSNRVLVSELNTLPGFTAISMYPKLWEASGVPLRELLNELIRLAIERHERRGRLQHEPPRQLG
jgi:D-alanine-D-alanine ligase